MPVEKCLQKAGIKLIHIVLKKLLSALLSTLLGLSVLKVQLAFQIPEQRL